LYLQSLWRDHVLYSKLHSKDIAIITLKTQSVGYCSLHFHFHKKILKVKL